MEVNYTVRAERSGKWWSLECVEVPGALSQVIRLDQADQIKEAIAFVAGVPEESVEITVVPLIDDSTKEHLAAARRLRAESQQANRLAADESRAAAKALAAAGLSVRDVGSVMGVSFQRAQQLTKS